jgi:surface antigen
VAWRQTVVNLPIGCKLEDVMFNAKVLVAKSLMVVGKLSILVAISTANAGTIANPKFFDYPGGNFVNRLATVTFGWFRKLDDDQNDAYTQAISHAVMYAENGNRVDWYRGDASGYAVPVMTWPNGSGYCRRIHTEIIAFNMVKSLSQTACFSNADNTWRWVKE